VSKGQSEYLKTNRSKKRKRGADNGPACEANVGRSWQGTDGPIDKVTGRQTGAAKPKKEETEKITWKNGKDVGEKQISG